MAASAELGVWGAADRGARLSVLCDDCQAGQRLPPALGHSLQQAGERLVPRLGRHVCWH